MGLFVLISSPDYDINSNRNPVALKLRIKLTHVDVQENKKRLNLENADDNNRKKYTEYVDNKSTVACNTQTSIPESEVENMWKLQSRLEKRPLDTRKQNVSMHLTDLFKFEE